MSSEPPAGSGPQPPEDDPFRKQPPPGQGAGSPYGGGQPPSGGGQPPPHGGEPHGGGGYPSDPLVGMPPLADSGRRTLARIIDMIMVGIVVWLVTLPLGAWQDEMSGNRFEVGRSFAQSFITAVLFVAYDTFMIARSGQTLGKKWLRMRVANLEDGSTPSTQNSLVRALVLWVPFAFCCACVWTAICGGWSFFDRPYKQGLHDKAAKTVEVSTG